MLASGDSVAIQPILSVCGYGLKVPSDKPIDFLSIQTANLGADLGA